MGRALVHLIRLRTLRNATRAVVGVLWARGQVECIPTPAEISVQDSQTRVPSPSLRSWNERLRGERGVTTSASRGFPSIQISIHSVQYSAKTNPGPRCLCSRGVCVCVPYEFIMCSLTLGSSGFVEDPSSDSYILSRTKVSDDNRNWSFRNAQFLVSSDTMSWILCMNPC